jgi:glycine/D-amino acid oxidase-like deaminating enzyme
MNEEAASLDPHLLHAAELDYLEQITDEAARHALAHYADEQWADPAFAAILLNAARSLRAADRLPSDAIVQAMRRCLEAQQWASKGAAR